MSLPLSLERWFGGSAIRAMLALQGEVCSTGDNHIASSHECYLQSRHYWPDRNN